MDRDSQPPVSLSPFWKGVLHIGVWLWQVIWWVWSSILIGGLLVGSLISLATSGTSGLADPRTWIVIHPLLAHPFGAVIAFVGAGGLTLFSFFAYRYQKRTVQQRQRAHDEALVDIARGVRHTLEKLDGIPSSSLLPSSGILSDVWHVPYRRNPFFTGRERLLKELYERFTLTQTTAPITAQALCGLGGMGKTQTAIEYAYRYREAYHFVLWIRAASRDTIITDLVTLAEVLRLPERHEHDQRRIVGAVKQWFAHHTGWLLILDNADDVEMIIDFLPTGDRGHILLTTHAQAIGAIAHAIEVEKMDVEEGTLLLLRRAKLIEPAAPLTQAPLHAQAQAQAIVLAMDGLPLALDQAGAYIEETACGLTHYLALYRRRKTDLLKRRGKGSPQYPHTVATTWSLSFQHVQVASPSAADLLRLCAFLYPDIIPEEIFSKGAPDLGPALEPVARDAFALNDVIELLRTFSLIRRMPEAEALTIHRLVQVVLQDGMDRQTQQQWAERVVRAINRVFPEAYVENWPHCRRYLPQVYACAELMDSYQILLIEAGRLLNEVGVYLRDHAQYKQAEIFLRKALDMFAKTCGSDQANTCGTLDNLAILYAVQGRYAEAEPLYHRALATAEKVLGHEHTRTASILNNLGQLYRDQGHYEQAELLVQRALTIQEQVLGPVHQSIAPSLTNLAGLHRDQGHFKQAEPLYQHALMIAESTLGHEHPGTAVTLNDLAGLYRDQGSYEQAEPLYRRALAIREQAMGPEHPDTATTLENYADLLRKMKREQEAEAYERRAKTIRAEVTS